MAHPTRVLTARPRPPVPLGARSVVQTGARIVILFTLGLLEGSIWRPSQG